MNWKAVAKKFKAQRDEAWANETRRAIERALAEHAQKSGDHAEKLVHGLTSKSMNDALLRLTGILDAEHFRRLLEGHTNIGVILHVEFERRFPLDYLKWMEEIEK